jgi:hypothetical protein
VRRECDRYQLNLEHTLRAQSGSHVEPSGEPRPWWDYLIMAAALAVFVWFAAEARVPRMAIHASFAVALTAILLAVLVAAGWMLWKQTRFG